MSHPARTLLATIMLALAVLALAACGQQSAQPSANSDDPRADWPDEIVFGLVPSEGGADIVERFAPLITFLNEELGCPVVAKPASEYAGVITAMQNKQVELAYFGPKSYVEASRVANAEAIIKELNADGIAGYKGTIIVHVDSPAETLADTEGMTFAFVTPNSTSGYLVPALGIQKDTGKPAEEFFSEIRYTGSHGSSMNAVATGAVQAAATNTLDMNAMANAGQVDGSAMKVIWTSDLIPSAPIAVRRDIPESLKAALREAFLAFNEHPDLLKQMSRGGFVTADDKEYDSVRMLEQRQHDIAEAASHPKPASDG